MLAAVADVLIVAALVLGGDATLKILYMKLIEGVTRRGSTVGNGEANLAAMMCRVLEIVGKDRKLIGTQQKLLYI
ncbi:hypothetical protein AAHA92_14187 [Salvia divinorum]|uniref:Uncharacterized protein n=1 Tax=Salvia divinorum TaxID=28513 RepID=A0ABD1HE31_SALDI